MAGQDAPEHRAHIWSPFASPELERALHRDGALHALPLARVSVVAVSTGVLLTVVNDIMLVAHRPTLVWLVLARCAVAMVGATSWWMLRGEFTDENRFYWATEMLAVAITLSVSFVATTRSSEVVSFPMSIFALIVIFYAALPLRGPVRTATTLGLSALMIWWAGRAGLSAGAFWALVVSMFVANALGVVVLILFDLEHRSRFLAMRALETARESLERSLAEVRRLEGIIPICAHCKKVRDDAGFWQQVESYVAEHSSADFSHGICPDCAAAHFPES